MKKYLPWIIGALFFLGFFALSLSISQENIRIFIQEFGPLAPIIFILLSLTSYIIAPLSGTPVLFAGHVLFGQQVIIFATIAAYISFISNFWISRIWGRSFVTKLVGRQHMAKIDEFAKNYGVISLFISRFFLGHLHDVISYASGLTSMKFSTYITVSTIATIPGILLWIYLSKFTTNSISFVLLTLSIGFIFLFIFLLTRKIWTKIRRSA